MSSPSKNHSSIHSERFSPVKIPDSLTPLTNSQIQDRGMGLQHRAVNKHNNRRNTIHHNPITRRKFVETPLKNGLFGASNDIVNPILLTSPRLNKSKSIDLKYLTISRENFESKIQKVTNKENDNPFKSSSPTKRYDASKMSSISTISSPIKRNNEDYNDNISNKVAKFSTKEGNTSSRLSFYNNEADHLVQVDEVFVKEDLIGRMNEEKSSPNKRGSKLNSPIVIDNDSDSDPEDYGRIENTTSQTIVGNSSVNKDSITQLNKIIKSDKVDYITPQRYTAPVAKSPSTNQHIRINEEIDLEEEIDEKIENNDVTSPLKKHKLSEGNYSDEDNIENNLENEPTINFLMSPNSKPVFLVDQITKIQGEFSSTIDNLQKVISEKNQDIVKINQELASCNTKLIMYEQEVKELLQLKKNFLSNEEILYIQLKHNERELASLTKNFKIKENTINHLELIRSKDKSRIDLLKSNLDIKMSEYDKLEQERDMMRKDFLSTKLDHLKTIDDLKATLAAKDSELEKLSNIKLEANEKNIEIDLLRNAKMELNKKVDELIGKEEDLSRKIDSLTKENSDLKNKLQEERDLNLRQEELVKELDKLENLAKDRILSLENSLQEKDSEIEAIVSKLESSDAEKGQLVDMCDKLEKENSRIRSELTKAQTEITELNERINDNNGNKTALHSEIVDLKKELNEYKNSLVDVQSEKEKLHDAFVESENKIKLLTDSNQEKDRTIIEDTKRMNELVNAVDQQKKNYENKISSYQEEIKSLNSKIELSPSLSEENEFLRKQVKSLEALLEKKILEVATYLHQEYAEKHIKKLREVKDKYEKELGVSSIEKKSLQREIELLKRKLIRANEECQRVSEFVHLNKLNYLPSNVSNSLSPKKSSGRNKF